MKLELEFRNLFGQDEWRPNKLNLMGGFGGGSDGDAGGTFGGSDTGGGDASAGTAEGTYSGESADSAAADAGAADAYAAGAGAYSGGSPGGYYGGGFSDGADAYAAAAGAYSGDAYAAAAGAYDAGFADAQAGNAYAGNTGPGNSPGYAAGYAAGYGGVFGGGDNFGGAGSNFAFGGGPFAGNNAGFSFADALGAGQGGRGAGGFSGEGVGNYGGLFGAGFGQFGGPGLSALSDFSPTEDNSGGRGMGFPEQTGSVPTGPGDFGGLGLGGGNALAGPIGEFTGGRGGPQDIGFSPMGMQPSVNTVPGINPSDPNLFSSTPVAQNPGFGLFGGINQGAQSFDEAGMSPGAARGGMTVANTSPASPFSISGTMGDPNTGFTLGGVPGFVAEGVPSLASILGSNPSSLQGIAPGLGQSNQTGFGFQGNPGNTFSLAGPMGQGLGSVLGSNPGGLAFAQGAPSFDEAGMIGGRGGRGDMLSSFSPDFNSIFGNPLQAPSAQPQAPNEGLMSFAPQSGNPLAGFEGGRGGFQGGQNVGGTSGIDAASILQLLPFLLGRGAY